MSNAQAAVKAGRRAVFAAIALSALALGIVALATKGNNGSATLSAAAPGTGGTTTTVTSVVGSDAPVGTGVDGSTPANTADASGDLAGDDPGTNTCLVAPRATLRIGDSGHDVVCLQQALITGGYLTGTPTGSFDNATFVAVKKVQTERDMFVDGEAGRETAISLGIWPDEASFVIHTPKPAAGAKDTMGYTLSSVATSGPDAPPLPANSGSGRRVVYSRAGQRVWAVDKNNNVIRSWLVSGSKYSNEEPGAHVVFSRSEVSTAWNGKAWLPHMIRYQKTKIGNIGFHGIPIHRADNTPYMTEDQLGTRLSGGCQRQANLDADFMWAFAQIGTPVIVI